MEIQQKAKKDMRKTFITYGILIVAFALVTLLVPEDESKFGALTFIPAIFLLIYVFYSKRILESLILSSLLGYLMAYKLEFLLPFSEMFVEILVDPDIAWLFIVCGLMGSIIALIEKAGGAFAFGDWVSKRAKTRKSTLMWTWILGVVIFIDDYLNCLTIGASMAPITDRHKVSREFLAYIVDSTAAPVCILIPISTWAIFIASLLEQNGLAEQGKGMHWFIKSIPYNYYGWIAAFIVPLVILGIVPIFGPMKKAEKRARETGVLAPPGSEKIDIRAGEVVEVPENPKVLNFFLPIFFLIGSTVYFDDMQLGVITTVAFMFFLYIPQGLWIRKSLRISV